MSKGKVTKAKEQSTTLSKKRKVSHAGARQKGLAFERWVANQLGHIFIEAERRLESQASKCIGVDIDNTDRIKIQCKNYQNYCSIGTIHEIRTKDPNDIPVLVTKGNKLEAMAVLPFEKLVTLLEIAYGLELPFRVFEETKTLLPLPALKLVSPPTSGPKAGREDYVEVEFCDNALDRLI